MTTPAAELRTLATILTDGSWTRALELSAANSSPLRAATGGGGAIGDHSDPTAAAALRPTTVAIPRVGELRASLRVVAGHLGIWPGGPYIEPLIAARLRWAADHPPVDRRLLAVTQVVLKLHSQVITPMAAAAWMAGKDADRRERVEVRKAVRACEACDTPVGHCGRIRGGWCDACYSLSRIWVTTRPELVNDDLALDHQRFAAAVAQAVASGELQRPWSPHATTRAEGS